MISFVHVGLRKVNMVAMV